MYVKIRWSATDTAGPYMAVLDTVATTMRSVHKSKWREEAKMTSKPKGNIS